jgi:hypothetical protein
MTDKDKRAAALYALLWPLVLWLVVGYTVVLSLTALWALTDRVYAWGQKK